MSWSKAETTGRRTRPFGALAHAGFVLAASAALLVLGVRGTQNAVANGDTRTITIRHMHTKEETTVTFRRDGRYVSEALEKLNWALRDWRIDEPIRMDPRLFDLAWEVHRKVGSEQPFHVVSAYRSPGTNSMLRRRSRGVAKHSQHMVGKAMDFYLPDTPTARIREAGMRMQRGGVGFYPGAHTPFVHLDAGSVRSWPRMTRDQLVRLFPDEKTVHLPADGKPLSGYETAKAEILAGGGSVMGYAASDLDEGAIIASGSGKSFWAALFGGDDEEADARPARGRAAARRGPTLQPTVLAYADDNNSNDGGRFAVFNAQPVQAEASGRALLRERSNRATTTTAPQAETQVAAPAPPPEPARPSPIATSLPVPRPAGLAAPEPPAGATQLAALAAEASALPLPPAEQKLILASLPPRRPSDLPAPSLENIITGRAVSAPLPPIRPLTLASLAPANLAPEGLRLTDNGGDALPAGAKLVNVSHPLPPIRPRAAGASEGGQERRVVELAGPQPHTPIAAEYDADRAGLDSLFAAVARPAAAQRKTTVATARAKVTDPEARGWVVGPSPAAALGFSAAEPSDVGTGSFSGPAVRSLPTTFVQN